MNIAFSIAQQYFKNNENLAAKVRNFRSKFGQNSDLTSSSAERIILKFRGTGLISNFRSQILLQQIVQLKTSKQFVRVLLRDQEHQLVRNWTFREAPYCVFSHLHANTLLKCRSLLTTSKRVRWVDCATTRECYFFEHNPFQRWGSLISERLRSSSK